MNTTPKKSGARRALTTLMWLPSLSVGAMYALAWNHLPTTTLVFPDVNRGWASRSEGLIGSLTITSGLAMLGTSALAYFTEPEFSAFVVLGFFYVSVWAQLYVEYLLISLYVKGAPIDIALVPIASIAAAVAIISVALLTHRRSARANSSSEARPQ